MKVTFRKDYILVVSPHLVYLFGFLSGTPKLARAAAFYPFLFVKSEEMLKPWLLQHELIHFKQQKETLFVGLLLLDLFETMYAVVILKKSMSEAYKWRASEQEAYRNQQRVNYIKERKPFALFSYIKEKKEFEFGEPGKVIFKE